MIKELRIGSWVRYKGHPVHLTAQDFAQLEEDIEDGVIKPETLNEHWCEKLGFDVLKTKNINYYSYMLTDNMFAYYDTNGNTGVVIDTECGCGAIVDDIEVVGKIKYVHILQNLIQDLS